MEIVPEHDGMEKALAALATGHIVAHATETCYGLACDVTNVDAVARLFAVKRRPTHTPMSILFSSLEQAKEYVEWNALAELFANELPGPVTLVLHVKERPPNALYVVPKLQTTNYPSRLGRAETDKLQTIGVRVSSLSLAQTLVQRFGRPLSTTSANLHGKPPSYTPEDILLQFSGVNPAPDLILDSGPLRKRSPSRVIDCTGTSPKILRA